MGDHPTTAPTDHPTRPVGGRVADWLGGAFYVGVAAVALAGQTTAAREWLGWPVEFALPAVGLLELGGIALAARSDYRRRLGERAVAARVLSTAVAVFAVVFNWVGHTNHLAGGFFAGMSALGYCVWLINAGDRRRDQLRATGRLPVPAPTYPLMQWIRCPGLTRRARVLAVANPLLGLHESILLASEQVRVERRRQAISKLLAIKLTEGKDPLGAQIAVTVYDPDEIAKRIEATADYDGLAELLARDLNPGRVLGDRPRPTPRKPVEPTAEEKPARPTAAKATGRRSTTQRVPARPVGRPGERAAVANARILRSADYYPTGLPDSERVIRARTGWSKERVGQAVAAYRAGEDLASDDDKEDRSA
jgi:hypothetical protein